MGKDRLCLLLVDDYIGCFRCSKMHVSLVSHFRYLNTHKTCSGVLRTLKNSGCHEISTTFGFICIHCARFGWRRRCWFGWATVCAGCHGIDGKSTTPGFPNLAGQDFIYLKNQLINFRNKSRTGGQAAVMYGLSLIHI